MYTCMGTTSIAHTTGNVTYILIEYLKGLFVPKFFKHVHITSRMPYREFMMDENKTENSFIKKNRPILIVKPTVIIGDDDIFMSYSRFTRIINGTIHTESRSQFLPVFRDNINDITLSYLINRIRVQLEITILLDTEYSQINIYSQLTNTINENQIYWMNTALECYVPREFIDTISKISKIPIKDENNNTRKFLEYLMKNSNKYFTYKEKTASSLEEFFVYYPIVLEYVVTNFSRSDMNKHGSVTGSADISFTLTGEFNTMGMFQLSTERDDVLEKANAIIKMDSSAGTTIIPFYTVQNLFKETDKNGWRLLYTNMFSLDDAIPLGKPEPLDISPIIRDELIRDVIQYHKKNGISNDILLNFILMKNNEVLNADRSKGKISYVINYDKDEIMIYNRTFGATYRIIVYVNTLYIATLRGRINDLEGIYERKLEDVKIQHKEEINYKKDKKYPPDNDGTYEKPKE